MAKRKKIAAIVTTYFPYSHSDLIVSKFASGFPTDQGIIQPEVDLVSMYIDQFHTSDVGVSIAKKYGVTIYPSIRAALTLTPPSVYHWPTAPDWRVGELSVDGVLIIGEHGDYSGNERKQQMYPRKYFFEQVMGIFATSGRSVPVFNDKHLAYSWSDCEWIYKRSKELGVPFMAGSSLPVTSRTPELEHEIGTDIQESLSMGHFNSYVNGLESYGFHGLEALQCMVERRSGGETGVASVHCLEGEQVWEAGESGLWPRNLADEVELRIQDRSSGNMEDNCVNPAVFMIEYLDGFKATTLMLDGHLKGFGYSACINGEIVSTVFNQNYSRHESFTYQCLNLQKMFLTGQPQYPVERTLLVSGMMDALMESRFRGHVPVETPYLNIAYSPPDNTPIRPLE